MTKLTLTTDAKGLNSLISKACQARSASAILLHVACLSSFAHACEHGNATPLTRLYNGVAANDQRAIRQYVGKVHMAVGFGMDFVPDNKTGSEYEEAELKGRVVVYAKGAFGMAEKWKERAKNVRAFIDEHCVNPDGKKWKHVLETDNFKEQRFFSDVNIFQTAERMLKDIAGREGVSTNISPKVAKLTKQWAEGMQSLKEQGTDDDVAKETAQKPTERRERRGRFSRKATTTAPAALN